MARTTISISDGLKKRMDKVKESVNWSAVAANAFELKLGEIARKRQEKTMVNVVERLRASKIQRGNAMMKEGHEAGVDWAEGGAEFDELERVAACNPNELFAGLDEPGAYAYNLAQVIGGLGRDADHQEIWDVWQMTGVVIDKDDPRLNSEDFLRGFIEGADEVYRQVADKI